MKQPIRVLSTKKLLVNQKQFLLNANISLVEADFISINQKKVNIETINENLIFTSQNAVLSLIENLEDTDTIELLKKKNVFCVGMKTKGLLEENGFNVIAYTGYAADLAEIITLIYGKEKFTFFSGNLRRDTLPDALKEAKIVFDLMFFYKLIEMHIQLQLQKSNPLALDKNMQQTIKAMYIHKYYHFLNQKVSLIQILKSLT